MNEITAGVAITKPYSDIPSSVGPSLRQFRLSHRLTVSEMAEICGIHWSTWGYYETGKRHASEAALKKVCSHFHVTLEDILGLDVEEGTNGRVKGRPRIPNAPVLHIQSQTGRDITVDEIMKKVPVGVEHIYVKAEEGHAYWTRKGEAGVVEMWG